MHFRNVYSRNKTAEQVFNSCATAYHQQLARGLKVSGESPDYFAEARIAATSRFVASQKGPVGRVLDFGCGVGTAAKFLLQSFPQAQIIGSDIAQKAIDEAHRKHADARLKWVHDLKGLDDKSVDLIYCNGVFHHIPPNERDAIILRLANLLRPGGYFALWENNPWNPATRWVMSRIAFDRDAVCLSPIETWKRIVTVGLNVKTVEFHFFFPRWLAYLRCLERPFRFMPLGAQYVVLGARE